MRVHHRVLLIAALLGLGLLAPAVQHLGANASVPVAGPSQAGFIPGSLGLYKLGVGGTGLLALDPRSLADRPDGRLQSIWPAQKVDIGSAPTVASTPNGARFVVLATKYHANRTPVARDMLLQVFDARTGRALTGRHHPAIPFSLMSASADGTRLFGTRSDIDWNDPCAATDFYILDARTGRILRRFSAQVTWSWQTFQVDVGLHRLYVLNTPDGTNGCHIWTGPIPTVVVYSLTTGKLLSSRRLPRVQAGVWSRGRVVNHQTVTAVQNPGFALSPDGSQLAVLDGPSDSLTLLDARSLTIEATERIVRRATSLAGLVGALGLAPMNAEAKGEETGMSLLLQYTSDGRSLVVTGSQTRPDPHRRFSSATPLPLRLIDIASGEVKAQLSSTKQIYFIWPAPDGSGIYTIVPGTNRPQLCPCTLQRHDPATLRVLASRTFSDDSGLHVFFLQVPRA